MGRSSQRVQVGKRKIELSNLKKVLFPEDHVLKATAGTKKTSRKAAANSKARRRKTG